MLRLALRGLAARRRRAVITTLAVFLGVALMAGGYVFTDTINASFEDIFQESLRKIDVVVVPREQVDQRDREPPPFDASLLDRVRRLPGVEESQGQIDSFGRIVDREGDSIGTPFAPNFIFSRVPKRFEVLTYTEGRPPRTANETAIDAKTAERGKLSLGDGVGVAGETAARRYRIVGLTKLGDTSFGGAATALLTPDEAQRITDKRGKFDQLSIAAADGVDPEELAGRVRRILPQTVDVRTGEQEAAEQTQDIEEELGFLPVMLSVFAGVLLLVGGFLIFNTFSITVAQRIREFGMLRTIGASRRQLLAAVLLEASLIGVAGSLLGLAGGFAFAPAINALFESVGIDLPNTGTVLAMRTVVVSLALGIAVTLAAALVPALRATRVSPIAALREAELPGVRGRGRALAVLAVALCVVGLGLLVGGLFGDVESSGQAAGLIGGGAVAVLLGVSFFSPRLVRPMASLFGRPIERLRGITGRVARENAVRRPGRTAVTAAALMIGLALVSFVTVFAAGVSGSVDKAIDRTFAGDLVIQNVDGFSPIPGRVADAAGAVEGVERVSPIGLSFAKVRGLSGEERVSSVDPGSFRSMLTLDWQNGSDATLRGLRRDQAVIDEAFGDSNGVEVGDALRVLTPTGRRISLGVVGSVKDNADFMGSFLVSRDAMLRDFGEGRLGTALVSVAGDADAVQKRLERAIEAPFPTTDVQNQSELKDKQSEQLRQMVSLIYALLSLAVIVSLFGIGNTLALSIHERTRELGLLRAVGMTRRQVKRVIRYEAVITAMIGALLGLALGVVFAALVSRPLADEGFELSYPVLTLLVLLALAAGAGVLAAAWPARRAARLDVLEAVAYE